MRNIEDTVIAAEEKNNEYLGGKEILAGLKKELKVEAEAFIKSGFPVDDNLRLDINKLEGLYGKSTIKNDKERAEKKHSEFSNVSSIDPIGEALEISKTLSINRFWFKGEFIAIRTSQFDDYMNGVDELLIHKESNTIIAAIDSTTDVLSKADKTNFGGQKTLTSMLNNGAEVAYGIKLENNFVKPTALDSLPIFIINFNRRETVDLSESVLEHKISPLEEKLKDSLLKQSELFLQNCSPKMRSRYSAARNIFKSLKD